MNTIKITIIVILLIFVKTMAQDKVTSRDKFNKIEQSKQNYINKPLKDFLNSLEVKVKSVSYIKSGAEGPNRIILRFDDRENYNRLRNQEIMPARITVYFIDNVETKTVFNSLLNLYGLIEGNSPTSKFKNLKIQNIIGSSNYSLKEKK